MHRLHFDDDQVTLTLVFDEAIEAARALRLAADAFYLDGFAPDRNPAMWSAPLLKALARLAAPGATVATFTVRRAWCATADRSRIRRRSAPASGAKRDMLAGRYAPRWPVRRLSSPPSWPRAPRDRRRRAGLSGAAVASRLAVRGWRIDLVEGGSAPSGAASALRAGVFQPHVSRDDNLLSRFTRAGFPCTAGMGPVRFRRSPRRRHGSVAACCKLADGAENEARVADTAVALAHPVDYALHATRADATARASRRAAIARLVVSDGGIRAPGGDRRGAARPCCTVCRRETGAGSPPRPQCREPAARG